VVTGGLLHVLLQVVPDAAAAPAGRPGLRTGGGGRHPLRAEGGRGLWPGAAGRQGPARALLLRLLHVAGHRSLWRVFCGHPGRGCVGQDGQDIAHLTGWQFWRGKGL